MNKKAHVGRLSVKVNGTGVGSRKYRPYGERSHGYRYLSVVRGHLSVAGQKPGTS